MATIHPARVGIQRPLRVGLALAQGHGGAGQRVHPWSPRQSPDDSGTGLGLGLEYRREAGENETEPGARGWIGTADEAGPWSGYPFERKACGDPAVAEGRGIAYRRTGRVARRIYPITLAVVLFSFSHVFFPALTTLPSPPRAAFNPFFARRFKLVVFDAVDFLPRRFDGDFRAGFFLEDGRLADTLFFAALRLADFRVAAMAVSRLA